MRPLLFIAVLVYAFSASGGHPLLGQPAPELLLSDQYDNDFALSQYSGRILVLLASDRAGADRNRECGGRLGERFGNNIAIIGIADTRSAPFFLKQRVKKSFWKERVRVLMDWNGDAFTAFGLPDKSRSIIVINRDSTVRQIYADTEHMCEQAIGDIDALTAP